MHASSGHKPNIMDDIPLEFESNDGNSVEVVLSTTKSSTPPPPQQPQQPPQQQPPQQQLTPLQRRNVVFLILGFSCVVAGLTMIVGTGALVIQSISGGSPAMVPFFLACYFLGMSLVSLTVTPILFPRLGRTIGFWCGCFLTVMGSIVGGIGVLFSSLLIVLMANIIFGAGTGIGMYLRFAAVEVVPPAFAAEAVTWTLCGGCLAAFVGPEVAAAVTSGVLGDGNRTYLGVFIVTFAIALIQAVLVGLVQFDQPDDRTQEIDQKETDPKEPDQEEATKKNLKVDQTNNDTTTLASLLAKADFLIPVFVSVLSWSIMAQPMSIFRVTMREFGFTDRQSLTVIEFHFLSMYGPGFISGYFIEKYGTILSSQLAIACFLVGTAINLAIPANNNITTTALWFLGLMFLGMGWNFGFSAATVWVTKVYSAVSLFPLFKSKIQAANEAGTFFLSGMLIFSTGFIYDAGGGALDGWRTLNYFILALIALLVVVVAVAMKLNLQ
jgi:hypothetical protein